MGRRIERRRFLKGAGVLGAGLIIGVACRNGEDAPLTTLDATISRDGVGEIAYGPGESYAVRTELAAAQVGREERRRSLIVFHHFSDFRIVDEESPLRSEWVDACESVVSTSAFRPQEPLSVHSAAATIVQANRIRESPVSGRAVDFALHTGNAADNAQYNELRWFIDLMDGGPVSPDSGTSGYVGVQTESPAPEYGTLLADAQARFVPEALKYPWFAVAGNRGLLAQGTFPPNEDAKGLATGTIKVLRVGPAALQEGCEDPTALLATQQGALGEFDTVVQHVSADEGRRLLSRQQWVEEHFNTETSPGPAGHGFNEENRATGRAYYVHELGPVTLIVLDSTNPGGFSAGSIDATQFAWLEEQLKAHSGQYFDRDGRVVRSEGKDQLIIVASHHTSAAMNNPFPDPVTQSERFRGPQLEELLHRFPNVVLHVAGHGLEHRLTPKPDPNRQRRSGEYWEVTTASPLDFPMQARLLEIADNDDGTVSIFSTVYDTAPPVNPGDADDPTPDDGVNQLLLASVARQVGMRDPQLNETASGLSASDRNAELLLSVPFTVDAASRGGAGQGLSARRLSRRALLALP
jgi:metallophosphoesterase (TIGR03767 family)